MQYRPHARRAFTDPFILLIVLLPIAVAECAIDAYHALRAGEADLYDYESEVRRIALEPFEGDAEQIAEAERVWVQLSEAAEAHQKLLDGFYDPGTDEDWYITPYGYGSVTDYEEALEQIEANHSNVALEFRDRDLRDLERQREMALEALRSFEEIGITDRLQIAAGAARSLIPLLDDQGHLNAHSSGSGQRSLWRGLNATKISARQRGDWEGYVEYHRLSLALARHWMQQPDSSAWLQGIAMQSGSHGDLRSQLALSVIPLETIHDLKRIEQEQEAPLSVTHVLEEQRAESFEWLDQLFVEGGVAYIEESGNLWNLTAILLPRRHTAEHSIERIYEKMRSYSLLSIAERARDREDLRDKFEIPKSEIGMVYRASTLAAAKPILFTTRIVRIHEKSLMERLTIRILIGIELYRAEQGELPGSLKELVPEYLDEMPLDPFDPEAGMLRYRLLDEPDEFGRAYTLYSVGRDGIDNGGHLGEEDWPGQALRKAYAGTDYVMNYVD